MFARYTLKDHIPMGLLLIVIFHPFDYVHEIVMSVLVMHHPVVPWVVNVKKLVFDRVIIPSVHCVDGFQGSHGQQTVRVK